VGDWKVPFRPQPLPLCCVPPPSLTDSGGGLALSVVVADVDLDGKPDVLVGNRCGDQTCTTVVAYSGVGQGRVAVADVNGDGKPDLVLGGPGTGFSVLLGKGDGTFQFFAFYKVAGLSAGTTAVVADVNGDGKLDVVDVSWGIQHTDNGFVNVLLGNGDGTFEPAVTYTSGGEFSFSVAIADVNGGGKAEVVVASSGSPTGPGGVVGVLLGKGDGTFKRSGELWVRRADRHLGSGR
jgi:hypothetical protein